MKKNEKFETLTKMVGMAGFQLDEVVAYWQATGQLNTTEPKEKTAAPEQPKDLSGITILPSKKIVTPKVIEVGMFMYADGLIFPEIVKGNQITSVVGYAGRTQGLAVCLREKRLPWSSHLLYVGLSENLSGKEATRLIVEAARRQGKKADAAEYCYTYAEDGVKAGEAFLSSKEELGLLYPGKEYINRALDRLRAEKLGRNYLSSSEYNYSSAWFQLFNSGYIDYYSKDDYNGYVRPVLAFTL